MHIDVGTESDQSEETRRCNSTISKCLILPLCGMKLSTLWMSEKTLFGIQMLVENYSTTQQSNWKLKSSKTDIYKFSIKYLTCEILHDTDGLQGFFE